MQEKELTIAISMGGNLGDVANTFERAISQLASEGLKSITRSSILINPPVDCPPETPDFCNMVITGLWSKTPLELLHLTQSIEVALGRPKIHGHHTSRTIDLDIVLFGDYVIELPELQIPHPRATERRFVLEPLAEIAPELIFPNQQKSTLELLKMLL